VYNSAPAAPMVRTDVDIPMGTMAANWKKRRLRYVAVFGQLIGQVIACLYAQQWACGR
jgi:hypothetical protein